MRITRGALNWARNNPGVYFGARDNRREFVVRHTFKTSAIDYVFGSEFVGALGGEAKYKHL
jgi:hypothetical protein